MTERDLHRSREAALAGGARPRSPHRRSPPRGGGWPPRGLDPGGRPAEVPPLTEAELERRRADERARADARPAPAPSRSPRSSTPASWSWSPTPTDGCCGAWAAAAYAGWPTGSASSAARRGPRATSAPTRSAPPWSSDAPVHVQGPEHFVESHTRWGCAAAPLRDPWTGRTLGVLDVSGPAAGMHPAELALVQLAARWRRAARSVEPAPRRARPAPGVRRAAAAGLTGDGARRRPRTATSPRHRQPAAPDRVAAPRAASPSAASGCPRSARDRRAAAPAAGCCASSGERHRRRRRRRWCSTSTGDAPAGHGHRPERLVVPAASRPATPRSCWSPWCAGPDGRTARAARRGPLRRPHPRGHRARRDVAAAPARGQPAALRPLPARARPGHRGPG